MCAQDEMALKRKCWGRGRCALEDVHSVCREDMSADHAALKMESARRWFLLASLDTWILSQ